MELDEWGGGEDLEGVGRRERGVVGRQTIIKMHCMKKIIFNNISSTILKK